MSNFSTQCKRYSSLFIKLSFFVFSCKFQRIYMTSYRIILGNTDVMCKLNGDLVFILQNQPHIAMRVAGTI